MTAALDFENQTMPGGAMPTGLGVPRVGPRIAAPVLAVIALAGIVLMGEVLLEESPTDAQTVSAVSSGGSDVPVRSGHYVVVGPGDTLHSIALEHATGADQGRVIEAIQLLNGRQRSVEVGQVLALPLVGE